MACACMLASKSFAVFWRLWPEVGDTANATMSESTRCELKKEFPDLQPRIEGAEPLQTITYATYYAFSF